MITRRALPFLILSALALTVHAGPEKHEHPTLQGNHPGLDQFKRLAGTWVGKEVEGRVGTEVEAEYRVTSGGSTVVETLFPRTDHEMITVIHPDGDNLVLTHYCMVGNQPQMQAPGAPDGNQIAFKFVRATNLKSPNDMHMHDVTYVFVDKDTLRSEWLNYQGGKTGQKVVFELKRKK